MNDLARSIISDLARGVIKALAIGIIKCLVNGIIKDLTRGVIKRPSVTKDTKFLSYGVIRYLAGDVTKDWHSIS